MPGELLAGMGMGIALPPLFDFILAGVGGDEVGSASACSTRSSSSAPRWGSPSWRRSSSRYVDHGSTSVSAMTNTTLLTLVPLALATLAVFRLPQRAREVGAH